MSASGLRARLGQLGTTLREQGARSALVKSLQELRFYRRLLLFEVPLAPHPPRPMPLASRIRVRELSRSASDLAAFATLRPDAARDDARARLRRGHRCFVAALDGRLVSAIWIATGVVDVGYLECELQLVPHDAYVYDAFTLPSVRGHDVGSWRTELMKDEMRAASRRRLVSLHLRENHGQGRRAERRGYRPLGIVGWYGVGRWRRFFVRAEDGAVAALRGRAARARSLGGGVRAA